MVMVLIIVLAFANYFYVANLNLEYSGTGGSYYSEYFDNSVVDIVVSIYMLGALADFDSTRYNEGPDKNTASFMFLVATFIICVVFMNMLIAIMGETFGQVSEASVESGIREQVVLISDHAWLLDLQKIFKGKKYVIRVRPSSSSEGLGDPIQDHVSEVENSLQKKLSKVQNTVHKRIDIVDVNTRFLLGF